jgi:hypothetical protein
MICRANIDAWLMLSQWLKIRIFQKENIHFRYESRMVVA